jgi:hypothetical protein
LPPPRPEHRTPCAWGCLEGGLQAFWRGPPAPTSSASSPASCISPGSSAPSTSATPATSYGPTAAYNRRADWRTLVDATVAQADYAALRRDLSRPCPIRFMGLFDTVSSVGWVWSPTTFPEHLSPPERPHRPPRPRARRAPGQVPHQRREPDGRRRPPGTLVRRRPLRRRRRLPRGPERPLPSPAPLDARRSPRRRPKHLDPFDRMLAVQALDERMALVSCENFFTRYGATRLQ